MESTSSMAASLPSGTESKQSWAMEARILGTAEGDAAIWLAYAALATAHGCVGLGTAELLVFTAAAWATQERPLAATKTEDFMLTGSSLGSRTSAATIGLARRRYLTEENGIHVVFSLLKTGGRPSVFCSRQPLPPPLRLLGLAGACGRPGGSQFACAMLQCRCRREHWPIMLVATPHPWRGLWVASRSLSTPGRGSGAQLPKEGARCRSVRADAFFPGSRGMGSSSARASCQAQLPRGLRGRLIPA